MRSACTRLILRLAFHDQHVAISAMPSLPVLAFTFGASLLTGILFGVAPAWMMAHVDPADALRGAHRSTAQGGGWTQKSLVVTQAALSLVLLCAAGLLTRSLRNMQGQNFGFEVANRYILHHGSIDGWVYAGGIARAFIGSSVTIWPQFRA